MIIKNSQISEMTDSYNTLMNKSIKESQNYNKILKQNK